MLRVALLQLNSGPEISDNMVIVENMIRQAAERGAKFILTPENTCHMVSSPEEKLRTSPDEAHHPVLPLFSDLAKELGVWLMAGSIAGELCTMAREREEAFIAAMFQNLGRMLAEFYFPEEAREIRALVHTSRAPITEAQAGIQVLGVDYETLALGVAKCQSTGPGHGRCACAGSRDRRENLSG